MPSNATMQDQILDLAQSLIQKRGYNGFSFRDIAQAVGVKSSSIHYYFPNKTDLAVAVAAKYRSDFSGATDQLRAAGQTAPEQLRAYARLFQSTLANDNRVCLCGMLASEFNSVEQAVVEEVKAFFADQYALIASVVQRGVSDGTIRTEVQPHEFAVTYFSALEGAMIVARTGDKVSDIGLVAEQMIGLIKPA